MEIYFNFERHFELTFYWNLLPLLLIRNGFMMAISIEGNVCFIGWHSFSVHHQPSITVFWRCHHCNPMHLPQAELQKMKQQAAESKAYIEAQEAEERKLLKIIAEADAERVRQKKELDQVSHCCCWPCSPSVCLYSVLVYCSCSQ